MNRMESKLARIIVITNATVRLAVALLVFVIPVLLLLRDLRDPCIRSPGIPQSAWRLHRTLTPKLERWAKQRLESRRATQLSVSDISGTEWPLFGSVFYLWATESLQDSWETNQHSAARAPKEFAKEAIGAATRLVIDPQQASWVKTHWGTNYLKTENVFYRMLVISALTSHAKLTGDRQYLPMLKDQVESLSAELDASPHGVLNDYPGQCFPGDVLTAVAMIRKADSVLGTDHSAFVKRAIRGFQGKALDERHLVPYWADAQTGSSVGPSRGCGNSYVSLFSPQIWPEEAKQWYGLYLHHFWQQTWTAVGFREFPKDLPGYDWYSDVDAGPVLKGYGFAACAFGLGAARVNGHFEQAFPLTTEMYAASCPLPDGTLLAPRLLSNAADAPYLGESAILFLLSRLPPPGVSVQTGGAIPAFTFIVLATQATMGLTLAVSAVWAIRRSRSWTDAKLLPLAPWQLGFGLGLTAIGLSFLLTGFFKFALAALLAAQLLPRLRRQKTTHAPGPMG